MNDTNLLFQAQYLHDSTGFRCLIAFKLILALIAIPLLCKIRTYENKILVHRSLSSLLRFHYYYMCIFMFSCSLDYSLTLLKYLSTEVEDYVLSSWELFLRRYAQNLSIYGTIYSMFMMAMERRAASNKYQFYAKNNSYRHKVNAQIVMLILTIPCTLPAYDFGIRYPASTSVPEGGQIYYQIMNCPLTLIEIANIFLFEYLHRVNHDRLRKIGLRLTERYQVAENIRMLELLRPLARFHGCITISATIAYIAFVRELENDPSYPIFEEAINFIQLQGIFMPVIFMRQERKERVRKLIELKSNNTTNEDYVDRHNEAIMRGW